MNFNRKIFLWVLFLSFLPFLSQSQTAEIIIDDGYQSLENNFQVNHLSSPQLKLFQTKSIQILKDFLNIVDLISSKKYDSKFNEKLKDQALKSFSSENDSLFFLQKGKITSITIDNFLTALEKQKISFPSTEISNSKFSEPILIEKDYAWKVSFEFSNRNNDNKKFIADFILEKEKKKFGKKEKEVWEVFIKEIKEME